MYYCLNIYNRYYIGTIGSTGSIGSNGSPGSNGSTGSNGSNGSTGSGAKPILQIHDALTSHNILKLYSAIII